MVKSIERMTVIVGHHYSAIIQSDDLSRGVDMVNTINITISASDPENGPKILSFKGNLFDLQNDLYENEILRQFKNCYGEDVASDVWVNILTV